jgi:hypothetical protein
MKTAVFEKKQYLETGNKCSTSPEICLFSKKVEIRINDIATKTKYHHLLKSLSLFLPPL